MYIQTVIGPVCTIYVYCYPKSTFLKKKMSAVKDYIGLCR